MDIKDQILCCAIDYITINLNRKITLQDLRVHTSYSARALQLKFKKYLNQTPFEYIEEQRLLKAYELIKHYKQSMQIKVVAYEVGFRHLGRFSERFKKRFGISPLHLAKL